MLEFKDIITNVLKNGGATYTPEGAVLKAKSGFAVSLAGFETTFEESEFNAKNKSVLNCILNYFTIAQKENANVGFWCCEGLIYIDISKILKSKREAIKMGLQERQRAIYDIKKDKSIFLKH